MGFYQWLCITSRTTNSNLVDTHSCIFVDEDIHTYTYSTVRVHTFTTVYSNSYKLQERGSLPFNPFNVKPLESIVIIHSFLSYFTRQPSTRMSSAGTTTTRWRWWQVAQVTARTTSPTCRSRLGPATVARPRRRTRRPCPTLRSSGPRPLLLHPRLSPRLPAATRVGSEAWRRRSSRSTRTRRRRRSRRRSHSRRSTPRSTWALAQAHRAAAASKRSSRSSSSRGTTRSARSGSASASGAWDSRRSTWASLPRPPLPPPRRGVRTQSTLERAGRRAHTHLLSCSYEDQDEDEDESARLELRCFSDWRAPNAELGLRFALAHLVPPSVSSRVSTRTCIRSFARNKRLL